MPFAWFGQRFVGIGRWRMQHAAWRGSVTYPTCGKIVNTAVMENATGIPGLQLLLPVLDVCCLNLSVMENYQYGNYHHGLPGAGKPEEYSSKQQKTD